MNSVLKVLTLNCWGIKFISKDVPQRMKLIAEELAAQDYDVVALQEVWQGQHQELIKDCVNNKLPYSHTFHNGVIGTGLMILSKFPISDCFFHEFTFNGYFQAIAHHGDWLGGNGVGCVVVEHPTAGQIRVFNTHIHAEYLDNHYNGTRLLQSYQVAQALIQNTRSSDYVLICGDFNQAETELGIQVIQRFSSVQDSYRNHSASYLGETLRTYSHLINPYANKDEAPERLDYIFHSPNMECQSCGLAMQKHSETGMHFSDHEGYSAVVQLLKIDYDVRPLDPLKIDRSFLFQVKHTILLAIHAAQEPNLTKNAILVCLFIIFIMCPHLTVDHDKFHQLAQYLGSGFVLLLQMGVVLFCAGTLILKVVNGRIEVNAYKNVLGELELKISS